MTMYYAAGKLLKAGFSTDRAGNRLTAKRGPWVIELLANGGSDDVATIRVRRETDKDDMQSDYSAGAFVDSIPQALRCAREPGQ